MKKNIIRVGLLIICLGLIWFVYSNIKQTKELETNKTSNSELKTEQNELINQDNNSKSASEITNQALTLMSEYNAFTYMQYFYSKDFIATEFYKDNHSIIINTDDNSITYREYENNDRLQAENFTMEFTPSSFGFMVNDHGKSITDDQAIFDLIKNKLEQNNDQFNQFIILYLIFGATNDINIESRDNVTAYVSKKMLDSSIKASMGTQASVVIGSSNYPLTATGNILIPEQEYAKYFTNKQNEIDDEHLSLECKGEELCNKQAALKFLSYHLAYENDSNAGFMISKQDEEQMDVTVYAKDLPTGEDSASFTIKPREQTYYYTNFADGLKSTEPIDKHPEKIEKITEYNSTTDDKEIDKTCTNALNTLQKGENFYGSKAVPSDIGFSAFITNNNDVIIKTTILPIQENGGSGTAGIYTVKPDGTYELNDELNNESQCAYGKF